MESDHHRRWDDLGVVKVEVEVAAVPAFAGLAGRCGQRQLFLPAATIGIAGLQGLVSRVEDLEFSYCC